MRANGYRPGSAGGCLVRTIRGREQGVTHLPKRSQKAPTPEGISAGAEWDGDKRRNIEGVITCGVHKH